VIEQALEVQASEAEERPEPYKLSPVDHQSSLL